MVRFVTLRIKKLPFCQLFCDIISNKKMGAKGNSGIMAKAPFRSVGLMELAGSASITSFKVLVDENI